MNRASWIGLVALGAVLASVPAARAGLNDPISFSQAGTVTLTLDESSGGFDHILELSAVTGPVGVPVLALTDVVAPSPDVLGYTPALLGDTAGLGAFGSGEEIPFRLTNVGSPRLGDNGVVDSQIFSGSASSLNPVANTYYTYVEFVDPTTIKVYFEDVFGTSFDDPDPVTTFFSNGYDVAFTLTLTPVPEPATLVLAAVAALLLSWRRR